MSVFIAFLMSSKELINNPFLFISAIVLSINLDFSYSNKVELTWSTLVPEPFAESVLDNLSEKSISLSFFLTRGVISLSLFLSLSFSRGFSLSLSLSLSGGAVSLRPFLSSLLFLQAHPTGKTITQKHTHIHTHKQKNTHTYIHTHTHIHTHRNTHTYTH